MRGLIFASLAAIAIALPVVVDAQLSRLSYVAAEGQIDELRELLAAGADVNAQNEDGETALHWVARRGPLESARLLMESGAEINVRDADGDMPIHWAAELGRPEMVEMLLANGAELDAPGAAKGIAAQLRAQRQDSDPDSMGGETPLHIAVLEAGFAQASLDGGAARASERRERYVAVARLLIERGADVSAKGENGETPLHHAAAWGVLDVAQLLIEAGSDVNAKDGAGRTPLDVALTGGHTEIVGLLQQ